MCNRGIQKAIRGRDPVVAFTCCLKSDDGIRVPYTRDFGRSYSNDTVDWILTYVIIVVVVATLDGWSTSFSQNPFGEGVNEILKKCGFSKP